MKITIVSAVSMKYSKLYRVLHIVQKKNAVHTHSRGLYRTVHRSVLPPAFVRAHSQDFGMYRETGLLKAQNKGSNSEQIMEKSRNFQIVYVGRTNLCKHCTIEYVKGNMKLGISKSPQLSICRAVASA